MHGHTIVKNERSCLTAHSPKALSRPDVGKSRSAIRLEKLQIRTVCRIHYFTASYKTMPSTVGHQRAKCLLLVPFCESWQFMSSLSIVQYGIHNDVNPTAFYHVILQLGSICHCTSSIVQSSEQNLFHLTKETDQVCATFSVRNTRICTDFRHPVILAADLSVLMCTPVPFYLFISSQSKLQSILHFLMVPQLLVGLNLLCEVPPSHSDTPHWVGFLRTSDRPVAETSA